MSSTRVSTCQRLDGANRATSSAIRRHRSALNSKSATVVHELQRASANRDVRVLDALDDGVPMPLHRLGVHGDNLRERVEGDVPYVVILVREESPEDVDREDAQAADGLDAHDALDGFVQNRVSRVFGAVGVRRDVRENVRHRVRGFRVARAEDAEQPQHLHLQERVRVPADVVLGAVAAVNERLEDPNQNRHVLPKRRRVIGVDVAQLQRERHRAQEHAVMPVREKRGRVLQETLRELGNFLHDPDGAERGFFANVRVLRRQQRRHLRGDVARHLRGAYVPQRAQPETDDEVVLVAQVVLDRVRD
eukprot:30819-Pelagococcus_subviridis.AAC.6